MVATHRFRAMGTTVTLLGPAGAGDDALRSAARRVEERFEEMEQRFSRFRRSSELSTVNRAAGMPVEVSEDFAEVMRYALDGAERTGGLFDPTILPALVAAGYDRDFDLIGVGERTTAGPVRVRQDAWREVRLDGTTLVCPVDVAIDLGGLAKGWTVDRAAQDAAEVLPWAAVNAGGDLRILGDPGPGGLPVAVEDPFDRDLEVLRLSLDGGAVATSSTARRAWGPGLHHVIDPRTGLPAATHILQATVWARTCAEAELWSKWALLTGRPSLDRVSGVLVTDDGTVVTNLSAADHEEVA
jgi:thiamine biosynthesis lipoprotein